MEKSKIRKGSNRTGRVIPRSRVFSRTGQKGDKVDV